MAESSEHTTRVVINEIKADDWGIGGHLDWLRDYTSALDGVGPYEAPK